MSERVAEMVAHIGMVGLAVSSGGTLLLALILHMRRLGEKQ